MLKVILCLCSFTLLSAVSEDVPKLSLRAEAVFKKRADLVKLSVGVISQAETSKKALEENTQKMTKLVDSLKAFKLPSLKFETGVFSIQPRYTVKPLKASLEWKPQIESYQVQNTLKISLEELDKLPELIDHLVESGANTLGDLEFLLKNEGEERAYAIREAFQKGEKEALELSKAANQKFVKLLFLSLDDAQVSPFMMKSGAVFTRSAEFAPIQPAELEVRASVNLIYQIESIES
jgi:uncharacterized protein YggE